MPENHRNGWKVLVITGLFTIVMAMGGWEMQANVKRIELAEARVAALEAWAKDHEGFSRTRSEEIQRRLAEIEKKLDRLLEERPPRRRPD